MARRTYRATPIALALTICAACGAEDRGSGGGAAAGGSASADDVRVPKIRTAPTLPRVPRPPLGNGPRPAPGWPAVQRTVPVFELTYDAVHQAVLDDLTRGTEEIPGRVRIDGVTFDAQLRNRGNGARYHPKLSWNVRLPDGVEHEGRREFNLMAEWLDRGIFTDVFNWHVMAAAGIATPTARYVRVRVNGVDEGLFVDVEEVDRRFLRARGLPDDASIYRAGSNDGELHAGPNAPWQKPWEKKTREQEPWDEIYALERTVTATDEEDFAAAMEAAIELDDYLRYMAACLLIGYQGEDQAGNYWIRTPGGRFRMVPWDLNNATNLFPRLGDPATPPRPTRSILQSTAYDPYLERQLANGRQRLGPSYHNVWTVLDTRVWDRPELRARVLAHAGAFLDGFFTEASALAHLEALWAIAGPHVATDPYTEPADALRAPGWLAEWVRGRRAFLEVELARAERHGEGPLRLEAVSSAGGGRRDAAGEAEPWIELANTGGTPIALGGLTLTARLRDPFAHRLPDGLTIEPGATITLWADGEAQEGPTHLPFRLDGRAGELGIYDGVRVFGVLDLLHLGPMAPGEVLRRVPGADERWQRHVE